MTTEFEHFTTIRSLLGALAQAMNLINSAVEHHHEQTAYLSFLISQEMGINQEDAYLCVYAALLHDVGSILTERPQSVEEVERNVQQISAAGAEMLRDLPGFGEIAEIIAYCQHPWREALRCPCARDPQFLRLLRCAGIINLADKISAVLDPQLPVLSQAKRVRMFVESCRGSLFCPEAADAFLRVSEREFMWLDVLFNPEFLMVFTGEIHPVSLARTVELTRLMSRIIDFRSPFTAMHSAGVAASAKALAELAGMAREECMMMEIAGNLHDAGKLRVPRAILEKPGKLDEEEYNIIREHPYYTRLILMNASGFERIANWAGFHHEKLDGTGYPFHFCAADLDRGSRIMAIADIFSAITEDRPYRSGMLPEQSMAILRKQAQSGKLDASLVELLCTHYDRIDRIRSAASHTVGRRYYESLDASAPSPEAEAVG